MKFLLFLAILWGGRGLATETLSTHPTSTHSKSYELGLNVHNLVPNSISGFELSITTFGPHLGFGVGSDVVELNVNYGSNEQTSVLFLSELNYRLNVITPFITGYVLAGIHYLKFRALLINHDFIGPVTGIGFYFPMARDFKMGLGMKLYLPQKLLLSFGGSFAFIL